MVDFNLDVFGIQHMDLPDAWGSCEGRLLIVAGGRTVWEDLKPFAAGHLQGWNKINFDGDIMAVNDIGMHLPCKLRHWYSNDGYMLPRWASARRPEYRDFVDLAQDGVSGRPPERKTNAILHSFRTYGSNEIVKWPWPGHGGSGLNAVYTGLGLGYTDITIAGMPLDNSGHYFDPPWVITRFNTQVPDQVDRKENRWWQNAREKVFKGRVKSLSGRTKEWLK